MAVHGAQLRPKRARLAITRLASAARPFAAGVALLIGLAAVTGGFAPLSTAAARYAWNAYRAGPVALALDRSDANLAYVIGTYYFGNQGMPGAAHPYELALAERALKKEISIAPSLPLAHYTLARIEFVNGDFDPALRNLDAELALYPGNKRPLYIRGLVYAYRGADGDLARSEGDFRAFVAWAPLEWAGYNDLAYVLAKEKKYADAASVLADGIKNADGGDANPWLWNSLGVAQLNLGKPQAALASFKKAQASAALLTDADWQRAYPGNDPASAAGGFDAFKSGILENLATAYQALGK